MTVYLYLHLYWQNIDKALRTDRGIYVVATFESAFPKKGASTRSIGGHSTSILRPRGLRNIMSERVPCIVCRLGSTIVFNGCHLKGLYTVATEVTGATQKLVSAVNHIR